MSVYICCCLVTQSVQLVATPWTVAHQASLSVGFPRQEYWSGLPFPSPGELPDPGIEPMSLVSPTLAGRLLTAAPPIFLIISQVPREKGSNSHNCLPRDSSLMTVTSIPLDLRKPYRINEMWLQIHVSGKSMETVIKQDLETQTWEPGDGVAWGWFRQVPRVGADFLLHQQVTLQADNSPELLERREWSPGKRRVSQHSLLDRTDGVKSLSHSRQVLLSPVSNSLSS